MAHARRLVLALLLAACSATKAAPPAERAPEAPPSAASAASPASSPEPSTAPTSSAPAPSDAQSATAPAEVAPVAKPKSEWSVDGTSLSDIDALALAAAFKKAKLTDSGSAGGSYGKGYESVNFDVSKGKLKGRFYMVRPAKTPTPAESSLGGPEVALGLQDKHKSHGVLDKNADLYFEIRMEEGGKAADAKKLLDAVIKRKK